jgi:hypothetical protein
MRSGLRLGRAGDGAGTPGQTLYSLIGPWIRVQWMGGAARRALGRRRRLGVSGPLSGARDLGDHRDRLNTPAAASGCHPVAVTVTGAPTRSQ